ncbi:tRNA lysidine(34) synthetase TilS [Siccirubricoccus sp. G192]|uniref:tRNA lysidine(34) synthetase TilS n=1 Tax=Siccirubricoccus sp. G192 TaxID=2849651 RepID=UPI001C2BC170|nr:tRNA lysidine(34) synthetase TilS [Siccirubricoccus sp. G192]MBV1798016.1 tRNA lysidine(34) synthetase TilS [Siccirubricoccus sp. G192]
MAPLGPFGPAPALAAGVSGGPHSLALALLADAWARTRGGSLLALVVDHGLRPESGAEAAGVVAQLTAHGIPARLLRLRLPPGPGLQERARLGRRAVLLEACRAAGRPWLLLGHHRADQAETLLFRALRGSGGAGLAAMAPVRTEAAVLILRPLLGMAPARLEAVVAAAGLAPVRDPSNADPRFARIRLREALGDSTGEGPAVAALAEAAAAFGRRRSGLERRLASRLAIAACLFPEGFAEIDPAALGGDAVADAALAALVRVVGGAGFAPPRAAVAALRRQGGGTLSGAWLRPAGGHLAPVAGTRCGGAAGRRQLRGGLGQALPAGRPRQGRLHDRRAGACDGAAPGRAGPAGHDSLDPAGHSARRRAGRGAGLALS